MKRYLVLVTKILTTVFTVLTAILLTANAILMENSAAVSNFLGATTQAIIEDSEKAETEDTQYYKSEFNSVAEVQENGKKLGQQVVAEGSVLLKNDNAALPIAKGSKVNLYSASSVNLAVGGGGSSATSAKSLNLKECLTAPSVNLQINEALWNFYQTDKDKGTNAQSPARRLRPSAPRRPSPTRRGTPCPPPKAPRRKRGSSYSPASARKTSISASTTWGIRAKRAILPTSSTGTISN